MSSIGYRAIRLAQERKEQLRRQKVRHQAKSLLKSCQKQIISIKNPAVQQIAALQLKSLQQSLEYASDQIKQSPDTALQSIRRAHEDINRAIAQAEAEAERQRIQQLKDQANSLLDSSTKIIKGVSDPSIQQLAADDLRDIQSRMQEVAKEIQSQPEKAKEEMAKLQEQLREKLAEAQSQAKELSAAKAQAKAQIESVRHSLEAQKETGEQASGETILKAEKLIDEASSLYGQNQLQRVSELCHKASGLIEQAAGQELAESERREVVGGLLTTLGNMGFVVEAPVLEDQDGGNVVKLVGRMPSGRTAAFHVNLDGKLAFDFDGYEGRMCGKEMAAIEATLQEQFAIKMGPAQVTWKNPDKIAKGAMDLPSNITNRAHH